MPKASGPAATSMFKRPRFSTLWSMSKSRNNTPLSPVALFILIATVHCFGTYNDEDQGAAWKRVLDGVAQASDEFKGRSATKLWRLVDQILDCVPKRKEALINFLATDEADSEEWRSTCAAILDSLLEDRTSNKM
ncbi:hypothetical protein CYLTODRAFT_484991 [Cylindrobasidium torrendii FP15055 ss-10]|uniref:Uncharacterized protein n=1 Tax=Cylindrobasidium torrendii FP15055 ss-10 TaxID=1314674 RepID=A0A0D7BUJ1_9AGAR|nr:hypothetical protein CYLTODRAFT_484991 [Cylindrobasidium torrendii FP15055 ss-10]